MDHYICKINSGHGAQYGHIEVPEGQSPPIMNWASMDVGPFPSAEEAWDAWHAKQGNLQA